MSINRDGYMVHKKVDLGFEIQVVAFEELPQHLTISCTLFTSYTDKLFLEENAKAPSVLQFCDNYGGFIPRVRLSNCVATETDTPNTETWVNYYSRRVETKIRSTYTVRCHMDLRRFPFDLQILMINIQGVNCRLRKFKFKSGPSKTIREITHLCDYSVTALPSHFVVQNLHVLYHLNGPEIMITVTRRVKYYFFNYCLIIFLIVGSNTSIIAVPPDQATDRIAVTLTLLLTLVAFKFVMSDGIDKANYLTLMDMYILSAFGFIIFCLLENVLMFFVVDGSDHIVLADYVIQGVLFCLWCVYHLIIYFYCLKPGYLRPHWVDVFEYIRKLEKNVAGEALTVVGYGQSGKDILEKGHMLIHPHY